MKLRTKFTASFILTALVLCVMTLHLASQIVGRSYEALETSEATANFHVISNAVHSEIKNKNALLSKYGKWDDVHDHISGQSDYPVPPSTLLEAMNFADVDMIGYFTPQGLKYGYVRDPDAQSLVDLGAAIDTTERGWSELLDQLSPGYVMDGVLKSANEALIVSTMPVVGSDGSGAYVGHIVIGSRVDKNFIDRITQKTNIRWSLDTAGQMGLVTMSVKSDSNAKPGKADDSAAIIAPKPIGENPPVMSIKDDMTIQTRTFISDDGQTRVLLSAITPRTIILHGEASIRTLMLILAGSMIVALLVLQALLGGLMVEPVTSLTRLISGRYEINRQDMTKLSQRADEIGELYRTYSALQRANEDSMSALKSAAAKAEAANVSKSEFLANMSHEIRTPMNGVLGMAQVMRATELSEVQSHYVDLMYDSGMALMTVINDILDFSKIESGKMELDPEPFDLHAALESVLSLLGSQARDKDVDLIAETDDVKGYSVVGDVGRIRQILTNLVGNAIKFTSDGYVRVRATITDVDGRFSTVRFEVEDSGIGIPDDKLDLIFNKFTQAEGSTTRKFGGTGLGLSISRRIVELMGGQIGVESEFGHGSTFWFELTMEAQKSVSEAAPTHVSDVLLGDDLRGVVALIVDDVDAHREDMCDLLKAQGAKAYGVPTYAKGLNILKAIAARGGCKLPVMIAQAQMPDMDALEIVTKIRGDAAIAKVPMIMLSAADARLKSALIEQDIVCISEKSPAPTDLIRALKTSIGHHDEAHSPAALPAPMISPAPQPERASQPSLPLVPPVKNPKILIAEDNAVNREVLSMMFEDEPYDLTFVHDGKEAVDAMRVKAFDIVLMDISMPRMDGVEATKTIRRLEAQTKVSPTPIIAVTAHAMNRERDRYLAAGMDDHLPKPVIKGNLLAMIDTWLAKDAAAPAVTAAPAAAVFNVA